jgi:hypothetical protein
MDDVNVLMDYFSAGIQSTFGVGSSQISIAKNPARDGKQRLCGLPEGANVQIPFFVISSCEGDQIGKAITFENMTRQYPVIVEYIKRMENAATVQNTGTAPATILEDPDVRAKRTTLVNEFFVPTAASVANMWDVRPPKMNKAYTLMADTNAYLVSPVTFLCHLINPLPEPE